jgi:predicted dehydrogenase
VKNVRIAVLGMNQGYKFACDALQIPGVELVAVAGNNEQAETRAKELNVPLFKNYQDLIEECVDLDGVIITLPNGLHREVVELCAQKGLHVLVEKPIAGTVEDGEEMIKISKQKNIKLLVGHHRRFSSKLIKLKEIISSGVLGEIVGVNMLYMIAKDRPYFSEHWRLTQGGGPMLINGIHEIDTLRFVTGLTIQSAYAVMKNNIRKHSVEDSAGVILETAEGPIINYLLSDGAPSPWSYDASAKENPKFAQYDEDCYKIFGTKASISFPSFTIYSYDEENYGWEHELKKEIVDAVDNDPMTAELLHFIDVLRGETELFVTGEDGLETLKVISSIKRSAEIGQKVEINQSPKAEQLS